MRSSDWRLLVEKSDTTIDGSAIRATTGKTGFRTYARRKHLQCKNKQHILIAFSCAGFLSPVGKAIREKNADMHFKKAPGGAIMNHILDNYIPLHTVLCCQVLSFHLVWMKSKCFAFLPPMFWKLETNWLIHQHPARWFAPVEVSSQKHLRVPTSRVEGCCATCHSRLLMWCIPYTHTKWGFLTRIPPTPPNKKIMLRKRELRYTIAILGYPCFRGVFF